MTDAGGESRIANLLVENQLTAVFASPLPPACAHANNDYPSIALAVPTSLATGPAFPGDPFALSCVNASIPGYTPSPGYCVVNIQHNIPTDSRVVYNDDHTGASWFLPTGCILDQGWPICDGDYDQDGTPEMLPAPGIHIFLPNSLPDGYEIESAVWNPSGRQMDYTLNNGIREGVAGAGSEYSVIAHDHELEHTIANNNWVNDFKGGCNPVNAEQKISEGSTFDENSSEMKLSIIAIAGVSLDAPLLLE